MTALPLSAKCIKYLLFLFNLLFVITGIIILSVGATVHGLFTGWDNIIDEGYLSTSAFLVAIGLIIFIIAFFGCCGAVKENFCMIVTFSSLLIMVFIFEFSAAISGYVLKDKTVEMVSSSMFHKMQDYTSNNVTAKLIDNLQQEFQCCGVNNYSDWYGDQGLKLDNSLPFSCCPYPVGAINTANCTEELCFKTSCITAFGGFIADHALTIGGVAMGLAIIQLMGIIFSCYLSRAVKRNYESV